MNEPAPALSVLAAALPAEGGGAVVEPGVVTASPASTSAGGPATAEGVLNLAEVPGWALAEAEQRLPLVQRVLAAAKAERGAVVAALSAASGLPVRTLRRHVRAYRRDGFPGLLPKWGATKGRFIGLSDVIQDFLKSEYLQPSQPSRTTVYRRLAAFCEHVQVHLPCQATVNKFLDSIPVSAAVLARVGPKAWRAECEPKGERDLNSLPVGSWWVSDHREFDVFVKLSWWDPTRQELQEKYARPWLTAWLDLRSRKCVGWQVSLAPNSEMIACALRDGILTHGVPQHLYRDNGKDYTCHYWGGKARTYRGVRLSDEAVAIVRPGVLSPDGIQLHAALPYTPWSKPIESWFGHTFPEWEKTLPGWCGRDNKSRPEKLAEEIRTDALLTLEQFTARVAEWLDQHHATPKQALDGLSPNDCWRGAEIIIPQARTLDLLLMRSKQVTITDQGIRTFGRRYWHESFPMRLRTKVRIAWDPKRLGLLACFDARTGAFLCEATNQEALKMGLSADVLKRHHHVKREAKARAERYLQDRRALHNPDRLLKRLARESRASTLVVLPPRDLKPVAGTLPTMKLLPAYDRAAAQLDALCPPAESTAPAETQPPSCPPAGERVPTLAGPADLLLDQDADDPHADTAWVDQVTAPAPGDLREARRSERNALLDELCG